MTKHTPGPWRWNYGRTMVNIKGPKLEQIAQIRVGDVGPNMNEQEANARLIAAAPDLLAALQYQEMADADPEASRRKGYYERAAEMRRAAIAKATD